jgi:hypothetical protein
VRRYLLDRLVRLARGGIVALVAAGSWHALGASFVIADEVPLRAATVTDFHLDADGNAYVAGVVRGYDFPGVDSRRILNAGAGMRFVARYAPGSRTPAFTAIVGAPTPAPSVGVGTGFQADEVRGLVVDAAGFSYVPAYDIAMDYPVSGVYPVAGSTKYVYKVSPAGVVSRHSRALDPAIRRIAALARDASGAIYLVGSAGAGLQTTAGAPFPSDSVASGCYSPYAMKLDASGQAVAYATYLGYAGTHGHPCMPPPNHAYSADVLYPTAFAIALDAQGNAYVTGQAASGVVATPGAPDLGSKVPGVYWGDSRIVDPASHAFVTKLDATGTGLAFSARLGGSLLDRGTSVRLDAAGSILVAGKSTSPDLPRFGMYSFSSWFLEDCLLRTPEFGFLARLAPDGTRLLSFGSLPMDGGELDACFGGGRYGTSQFAPVMITADASGNIVLAGYTNPNNRDVETTPGAVMPDPPSGQSGSGNQVLLILAPDAGSLLYSSTLPQHNVRGVALDRWNNVVVASPTGLIRLAPGALPVDLAISPDPGCAGAPLTLAASVAAANGTGSVEFFVDGASVGSVPVTRSAATKVVTGAVGVRRLKAVYHGTGPFDGRASPTLLLPVNQAGACE